MASDCPLIADRNAAGSRAKATEPGLTRHMDLTPFELKNPGGSATGVAFEEGVGWLGGG